MAVDATLNDPNALLTDLVTVREACPDPVVLGVILPAADVAPAAPDLVVDMAEKAGYQRVIIRGDQEGPETADSCLERILWAETALDIGQQIDALEEGYVAVATSFNQFVCFM